MNTDVTIQAIKIIISGISIAIGVLGPAFAIGKIGTEALKSVARNPEASGKIMPFFILSVAFAEALAIYVLVLSLIIKFM
jgi:F-type H+-transporting ATPase subunit c